MPQQKIVINELLKYSKQFGLKIVATNDVHYVRKEHAEAHDVLLCIQTGAKINDENRMRYHGPEFYLKSTEEMAALFRDVPESLATTLEIADKCNLKIVLGENKFPMYEVPSGETRDGYLRKLCFEGLEKRFGERAQEPALRERLDFELNVLEKTGFTSYFLIVWDFIHYAKTHDIPVGPGPRQRGGQPHLVRARDHRPRSAQVRPLLRALPQSRARLAARYRRRLLLQPPARGHRLRAQEVRREIGRADHHLRHARREDGHPRRGPRHGPELRRSRPPSPR